MESTIECFVLRGCPNLLTLSLTMQIPTNGLQSCPVCAVDYVVHLVQFLLPVNFFVQLFIFGTFHFRAIQLYRGTRVYAQQEMLWRRLQKSWYVLPLPRIKLACMMNKVKEGHYTSSSGFPIVYLSAVYSAWEKVDWVGRGPAQSTRHAAAGRLGGDPAREEA